MARPLTARQMATRLKLYRLCKMVAEEMTKEQEQPQE